VRKVLIITYYWPPASGPGVQRILKFTKYLPEFGWQPVVLAPAKGEFPATDVTLAQDIPQDCRVVQTASLEPNVLYKKFVGIKSSESIPHGILAESDLTLRKKIAHWIRLNLFVPDAKIGWYPFAVRAGKKIIEREKPQLILSSSPPPTVQLVGRALATWSGLKWIADFRDPWTDIFYYEGQSKSALITRIDARLEKGVLQRADRVLMVSPFDIRRLREKNPEDKYTVLYNGYDAEDLDAVPAGKPPTKFDLVFVGTLQVTHNCEPLWNALAELVRENDDFRDRFCLTFVGPSHPQIRDSLEQHGLLPYTKMLGYQPHHVAIAHMKHAAALLFMVPDAPNNLGMLTGKIFEYLASGTPLLSVGPPDGDAAAVLRQCSAGEMIAPDDAPGLKRRALALFESYQKGTLERERPDARAVQKFERRTLVKSLAGIMDELVQ